MFIVKKRVGEKEYYYLRKSVREGGKVKAISVAYLGRNKMEAESKMKEIVSKVNNSSSGENGKKMGKSMGKFKNTKEEVISMDNNSNNSMEKVKMDLSVEELATFCKRKGFVFRSSEIYGGFAGFWDYGPLGVELFNSIKKSFWKFFVQDKEFMTGIEASIISHPRTWRASGHLDNFSDIAVVCKKCKHSTKIDKAEYGKIKCEKCNGEYESQGTFNLMFSTKVGALNSVESYLRGETAQGMFLDFKQVQETSRQQLPFGIAQVGKCFRNEIAPRDFIFRSREFSIAELEFFIHPDEFKSEYFDDLHKSVKVKLLEAKKQEEGKDELTHTSIGKMVEENKLDEWHAYWLAEQLLWFKQIRIYDKIKIREHMKSELSHYSSATFDLDYEFPFGSKEIGGIANRGQYDLNQHMKESKENLSIFDEKTKQKVVPRVIEPTFGMDRIFLALICSAYENNIERENIVLHLPKSLAPYQLAIFPIVRNNEELVKLSREVFEELKKTFHVLYDESGSIGRRYARNDEIGTPLCITIDEDSLKDESVTIRDRDTSLQVRVKMKQLKDILKKVINGEDLLKLGKVVETRKK